MKRSAPRMAYPGFREIGQTLTTMAQAPASGVNVLSPLTRELARDTRFCLVGLSTEYQLSPVSYWRRRHRSRSDLNELSCSNSGVESISPHVYSRILSRIQKSWPAVLPPIRLDIRRKVHFRQGHMVGCRPGLWTLEAVVYLSSARCSMRRCHASVFTRNEHETYATC